MTAESIDQPQPADVTTPRGVRFLLLLGASLVVAGPLRFDLQVRDALWVALHWSMVIAGAVLTHQVVRAYIRSGWHERFPSLGRLFVVSVVLSAASAFVPFALHATLPCEPYEIERYSRGLLLNLSVYLFANAVVVFPVLCVIFVLCARLWTAVAAGSLLVIVLHVIHVEKYLVLQQHLYTWDYMLAGDLAEVLPLFLGGAGLVAVGVAFGLAALGLAVLAWRESPREGLRRRLAGLGVGALATALLFVVATTNWTGGEEEPSEFFPLWNRHIYNSHYNKCGLSFTLLRGVHYLGVNRAPEGYSPEAMARIAAAYPRGAAPAAPTADVIFYMVESLEDLSDYGLTYATDPLPNFHALQREHVGGRLVVPIYGGNTPNTEFEMLTGLSRVRPWPHDLAYAYRQWITADTAALPWEFKRWGYRTLVVSGATGKYFGQEEAYPRLGFDEFRALGDREAKTRKFGLVSDESVVDEVISILGEDSTADRKPCFLAVTTDATHGPYRGDHDPEDTRFALTKNALPQEVRDVAEDYGRALHHADKALGRLVAFLKGRKRPAILFVYGDHKPAMGVFFDAGVFRTGWPGAVLDKYSTPLAIWSNLPKTSPSGDVTPLYLSANFLSAELFARLGIAQPPSTFHYTSEVYKTFRIVSRVVGDREGRFFRPAAVSGAPATLLRDYGFVKFDVLVGGRER